MILSHGNTKEGHEDLSFKLRMEIVGPLCLKPYNLVVCIRERKEIKDTG